jgi:hypothetical protein
MLLEQIGDPGPPAPISPILMLGLAAASWPRDDKEWKTAAAEAASMNRLRERWLMIPLERCLSSKNP